MLTHGNAKAIAEDWWGKGGTHSYKVPRKGIFYFTTSRHGGFVADKAAFTPSEWELISPFVKTEKLTQFIDGGRVRAFWWPYKSRSTRYSPSWKQVDSEYFLLEEDVDWSILVYLLGIKAGNMDSLLAKQTFEYWIVGRRNLVVYNDGLNNYIGYIIGDDDENDDQVRFVSAVDEDAAWFVKKDHVKPLTMTFVDDMIIATNNKRS